MITKFNDAKNYCNIYFDCGLGLNHIPENAAFAVRDGEIVFKSIFPYNGIPVEEIIRKYDEIDIAIIEEIARSKYLSSLQIYQLLCLRGFNVQRDKVRKKINKMLRHRVLTEYEIKSSEVERGIRAYAVDYKGFQVALQNGVTFHKGNCYIGERKRAELDMYDDSEDIKRILAGNMVVIGNLINGASVSRFGVMETLRTVQESPIIDGAIVRTAANIQIDESSILLYEVVRSTPHAMRKLADKICRYLKLIGNDNYTQNNCFGYTAVPQLVIVAESYEHAVKINSYLRSKGLCNEEDTILYTEDLFYMTATLQNLYELDINNNRKWYRLPNRMSEVKIA